MEPKEGRFEYSTIFEYLNSGIYPESFDRSDKQALRKRSKFFACRGQTLVYVGGQSSKLYYSVCAGSLYDYTYCVCVERSQGTTQEKVVIESKEQRKRILASVHDGNQ